MSEARTRAFIGIAAGAAIGSAGLAAALLYAGRSRPKPVDAADRTPAGGGQRAEVKANTARDTPSLG